MEKTMMCLVIYVGKRQNDTVFVVRILIETEGGGVCTQGRLYFILLLK